jgi:fermentation-respiration switch protein FrsA (DUF1100 family)
MATYKGYFRPRNPNKYKGNPSNIIYRSRWESVAMSRFDTDPNVVEWSSEELFVPYRSPIDGKIHRYFPDFIIKIKNKNGLIETKMLEIKPYAQTKPPEKQSNVTRRYITEVKTWGVNEAKWKAAMEFCTDRKWSFHIITERELGLKF